MGAICVFNHAPRPRPFSSGNIPNALRVLVLIQNTTGHTISTKSFLMNKSCASLIVEEYWETFHMAESDTRAWVSRRTSLRGLSLQNNRAAVYRTHAKHRSFAIEHVCIVWKFRIALGECLFAGSLRIQANASRYA